jgi:hypothetical protein
LKKRIAKSNTNENIDFNLEFASQIETAAEQFEILSGIVNGDYEVSLKRDTVSHEIHITMGLKKARANYAV